MGKLVYTTEDLVNLVTEQMQEMEGQALTDFVNEFLDTDTNFICVGEDMFEEEENSENDEDENS